MFYPADELRRGGRFYLCWVADSWPSRFEKLTHRDQQIWSLDIGQTCDHLRELMNSESGRPTQRFSLRLSSQLMRGLVRVYQRQVDLYIHEILRVQTMIGHARPRSEPTEGAVVPRRRARKRSRVVIEELPSDEENLEIIQERAIDCMVARVEDITLKEPTLPEVQLREDGFGELNEDSVEMMLAYEASAMQQSALDVVLDFSTVKSLEKSRLVPHDAAQMERISEHDISVFRKSAVEAPTLTDFEKEIPEISETPLTKLPAPESQMQGIGQPLQEAQNQEPPRDQPAIEQARQNGLEEIVLEDLQYAPPQKTRRLRRQLIVDNITKMSSDEFRVRVANTDVEQRCESTAADVIEKRVNAATLLSRQRPTARRGRALTRMSARGEDKTEAKKRRSLRSSALTEQETVLPTVEAASAAASTIVLPTDEIASSSAVQQSSSMQEARKFIDDEWGVDGTMAKILLSVKDGVPRITVEQLVARGPVRAGLQSRSMARCFASILWLHMHQYIKTIKDPETRAIQHIQLGPKQL